MVPEPLKGPCTEALKDLANTFPMETEAACWEPMVIAPKGRIVVPTLPEKETAPEVKTVKF